jgi:hypothetical protein
VSIESFLKPLRKKQFLQQDYSGSRFRLSGRRPNDLNSPLGEAARAPNGNAFSLIIDSGADPDVFAAVSTGAI